ncbi:glycoside hydrolase family 172 protein [Enterobacter sp. PGRG2]|uniref:glycoside hydrolase family 172 protein n=1 Tax=Enterobacter sp. PGRG2 TaxID=3104013 RepID=UPI002ABDD25F|nr:glycoside hydrolase family 172 protein [Enterobacter sp. PGRG2]WJD49401.1 DUF2961 domain-containing protein [Enterobacter sp. PGRG2]
MTAQTSGFLQGICRIRNARSGRLSSWDQSGRNQDYWIIPPSETIRLADIQGSGCITHIWMTQFCRRLKGAALIDPVAGQYVGAINEINNALGVSWEEHDADYYRKVLLKIYWDNQTQPSVIAPLGDFFCLGHSISAGFNSLPFTVTVRPEERYRNGGSAAFNCYLPMPFNERAIIEVENQNDIPYGQFFNIDFECYPDKHPADVAYFHAWWKRGNPCRGWAPELQDNSPEVNIPCTSAEYHYRLLDIEGEGHYIGCNLSVRHWQGTEWGEGDEMIFIDDDPPLERRIQGTGTEDYFSQAWGIQDRESLFCGSSLHDSHVAGIQTRYRFHLTDPIHFKKRILVTLQHGHANPLSSTLYWYQKLPTPPLTMQPVDARIAASPGALFATAENH